MELNNTETCDLCPERIPSFLYFYWRDLTGKLNNHNLLDGFYVFVNEEKGFGQGFGMK